MTELRSTIFVDFTPGHLLGWDIAWWEDLQQAICDAAENENLYALIQVGRMPPSRGRLVELLDSDYDDIRELAQTWMLPRISMEEPEGPGLA